MSIETPTGVKAVWMPVPGGAVFVEWSFFDPTPQLPGPPGHVGFLINGRNASNSVVETLPGFLESIGPDDRFFGSAFGFGASITKVEVYANYGGFGGSTSAQVTPNAHAGPVGAIGQTGATVTSVTIDWSAPSAFTGTITGYRVLYRANSSGAWIDHGVAGGTSRTVGGLSIGTNYQFMVKAVTTTGESAFSDAYQTTGTGSTVAVTVPDAPTSLSALRGSVSGTADLTWSPPGFNGGAPVTSYTVQYSSNGGASWTNGAFTGSLFATISGLTNGTSYVFRVAASNSQGQGPYTGASGSVIPGTEPSAPTGVSGTVDDRKSTVSWTAPNANGYAISGYQVRFSADNGVTWDALITSSAASPVVVQPLSRGVSYVFQVRAQNAIGFGPWSASSAPVVPTGLPDAPVSVTATWLSADVNNAVIKIEIVEPAITGGFPIDNYRLQAAYSNDGGATYGAWADPLYPFTPADTVPWFQVTEPLSTPNQWVKYRVAAITYNGTGPYAESVGIEIKDAPTPSEVPTAVQNLVVVPGNKALAVTWDPPTSAGSGGTISTLTYIVQYSTDGGTTWTTAP